MQRSTFCAGVGLLLGSVYLSTPAVGWAACSAEANQLYDKGTQVSRKYTNAGNPCEEVCLEEKRYFYQRAVDICEAYPEAHINLADVLEMLGRYPEALVHYTKAVDLAPGFAIAHFTLGDFYLHTADYPKAVAAYTKGLVIEPANQQAQDQLQRALCLKDKEVPPAECIQLVLGGEPMKTMGVTGIKEDRRLPLWIPFAFNKADLMPTAKEPLQELGTALQRILAAHPSAAFIIEGHTDVQGTAVYNQQLSEHRAQRVANHLEEVFQVPAQQLRIKGYGKTRLLSQGVTEADHARNRRVEVVRVEANELEKYTSVVPDSRTPNNGKLSVEVGVFYEDAESRPQKLHEGAVLKSGGGYRLYLTAAQPCYVDIFQIDAAGKLFHLYPNPKYGTRENFVQTGQSHWAPARDQWFALDRTKGQEQIYLVASKERREDVEDLIKRYLAGEANGKHKKVWQELEVTIKTMGVEGIRGDRKVAVESRAGQVTELPLDLFATAGVSLAYRFAFQHE